MTGKDQEQLTTQYTERAVEFIEKNKDKPFFLYVPHSMVHVPLYVSDKFKGKSERGLFGDVMMEIDWSVGQILDTPAQAQGLEKNTLVIFTSDNGPWLSYGDHAGSAGPLREGKGTMFDGGCREPTLMWWPGKIPAGTSLRHAGHDHRHPADRRRADRRRAARPQDRRQGHLAADRRRGRGRQARTRPTSSTTATQLQAVRMGNWKLHFPHGYRTMAGKPGGKGGIPTNYSQAKIGLELFNLKTDIGETKDLASENPELVTRMQAMADEVRADLGDGKRKGSGVRPAGRL